MLVGDGTHDDRLSRHEARQQNRFLGTADGNHGQPGTAFCHPDILIRNIFTAGKIQPRGIKNNGQYPAPPEQFIQKLFFNNSGGGPNAGGAIPGLTARESEIAGLLYKGFVPKVIGDRLSVSLTTVNTHIAHIYEKMAVSSRQELLVRLHNGHFSRSGGGNPVLLNEYR
jgi:DNA-binding CsgD family transcriptional regulator